MSAKKEKKCRNCGTIDDKFFYKGHPSYCKSCWNSYRRDNNKKNECRFCKIQFHPGVEGRYKFCSEKCRFLSKVDVKSENECWIWKAHRIKTGYGTFVPNSDIGKKSGLAHRASFRIFKDAYDDKLLVMHTCDNPPCVNPNHLKQGTPMDNTIDRKQKGRTTSHRKVLLRGNYGL